MPVTVVVQPGRVTVVRETKASPSVTLAPRSVDVTPAPDQEIVVSPSPRTVEVVSGGMQGPPGEDGTTGGAMIVEKVAGETLGGHRMVRIVDGEAKYADATVEAHGNDVFGLTTQASGLGDMVQIVTFGEVTEPSWNWTPEEAVFLGVNGLLTQTPTPGAEFDLVVGFALTPTTLMIDIATAIYYED